ncbi:hypothetical protein BJV82DRAFT_517024 [Fennellomyces sp. T-0311]|nr:hypothetical protein BJV82DRAFT_517024 [Fennellomyces sp. T-0311]
MGVFNEFTSLNFSLYAQWLGIASIILLIALGIVGFMSHIVFSIVGWVIALILLFVEIPLCLRLCPTSPKLFAVVMFLSNILNTGPLIAAAVTLLLAAICYGIAAVKGQAFASSRLLGGSGVDNVKLNALREEIKTNEERAAAAQAKIDELEKKLAEKDDELADQSSRSRLLDEQLERVEGELKEATNNFREADLRAEQLNKKAHKMEQESKDWDKKNKDLEEKYQATVNEYKEMEALAEGA